MTYIEPVSEESSIVESVSTQIKQGDKLNVPGKSGGSEGLVRSKKRVADHGEVFTPSWMVQGMLDLVKHESERIDSRFLEPACGSGNFLIAVLKRKFAAVQSQYGKADFERRHHGLLAVMSVYGIELLPDNAEECRDNLLQEFMTFLGEDSDGIWQRAASAVLEVNIINGDALKLQTSTGKPLIFPEWSYLGKGSYQRRDFRFDLLIQRSSLEGTLFEMFEEHEFFVPVKGYSPMMVKEIGQ